MSFVAPHPVAFDRSTTLWTTVRERLDTYDGAVSDIPVGSPPVPPGRHAAPSGWYADPTDGFQERYWDGWQWSRNTRPREGASPSAGPATYQPTPPPAHPPQHQGPQGPGPQGFGPQGHGPQAYGPPGSYGYAPPPGARVGQAWATADGVPLAGWWWRVLASVIDNVILSVISTLVSLPLLLPVLQRFSAYITETMRAAQQGQVGSPLDPTAVLSRGDSFKLALIQVGFTVVYQVLFLRWRAATPGLLICGLRVVMQDLGRDRAPLPWRAVAIRTAVWAAPGLYGALALFRLLDVLFPLWQPRRQTLHDLAAQTQVIRPGPSR